MVMLQKKMGHAPPARGDDMPQRGKENGEKLPDEG
jgi:hypothetical protein